ncbi:hypothetical protein [Magnetospirillum moscoviense]|uniref:Lipoprotein n=1 Tax=Magnetospirillum moscoviense TaxID=1437059 RepID=A0A178MLG1_9PROT|nr:hypothetical protein [Magnetospirillum moscoviense]MBF0325613.1 hypothetical protein [Alphaproteobacteria bacterium]OAN48987.1 hypothetical protein A6A05_03100 [Magnetospirillum moscoviense]
MKKFVMAAAGLAGISALAGCAQVQEPAPICSMAGISAQRQLVALPAATPFDPSPLLEMPLNSVSITDFNVINKLFVRTVSAQRTPTGTVKVISQIINCTDYPLNIEGRTQFYDQAQAPSEPVSAWKRLNLAARTSNTYSESSIGTKNVQYYMVEVRETR